MKHSAFPLAYIGAGLALLFAGGYVLFGPMDIFGGPKSWWAQIALWPGIYVGVFAGEPLHAPLSACYAAGVATMTLIGGVIGAALDLILGAVAGIIVAWLVRHFQKA